MKLLLAFMMMGSILSADSSFSLGSDTLKPELTKAEEYRGFGCNGENLSPELHWSNAPKGTKSFAVTVFDPDAPTDHGWWHWIVVNIPASVTHLPQNASAAKVLPESAVETKNDYGEAAFGGPCPPKGDKPHRYIFTVYALDTDHLPVTPDMNYAQVVPLIQKHTIAEASIMSLYGR